MAILDVRELIGMAVKDEETGIAFYEALAATASDAALKSQFKAIADQERHHAKRFRQMLAEIGEYKPVGDYNDEYEDYVNALLTLKAFPTPEDAAKKAREIGTGSEALAIALGMERDTLVFLSEMRNYVKEEMTQHLDAIIEEEREHVVQLSELKRQLAS